MQKTNMKDFTGYTVKSRQCDFLNGRTVVKTIKQIKTKTGRNLYEVQLNHNKRCYQIYEDELILYNANKQ